MPAHMWTIACNGQSIPDLVPSRILSCQQAGVMRSPFFTVLNSVGFKRRESNDISLLYNYSWSYPTIMDIFGTIVSAIDLAEKITGFLRKARSADDDYSKLLYELSALQPLLSLLRSRLIDPKSLAERLGCHKDKGKLEAFVFALKWPFKIGEIEDHLQKIERTKSLVFLSCQVSLMSFISSVESELQNIGVNVEEAKSTLKDIEEKQRIYMNKLESLHGHVQTLGFELTDHFIHMGAKITEATNNVNVSGTGNWFLEHDKFQTWLLQNSGMLWCYGGPGIGKTFLASVAVNYIQDYTTKSPDMTVLFVYMNYQKTLTTTELLRIILKQFGKYGFTEGNRKQFAIHKKAESNPTEDHLITMLKDEMENRSRTFLVIDALDECSRNTRTQLIGYLRKLLPARLNVLVTSRELGDISELLSGYPFLKIKAANPEDMTRYIKSRIDAGSDLERIIARSDGLRDVVISSVSSSADGMFLLAKLHMDSIELESNPKGVRGALKQLPKDLYVSYSEALDRIQTGRPRILAFRIFTWLTYTLAPLSLADLQYALAVNEYSTEVDPEDLSDELMLPSVCAGLVTIVRTQADSEIANLRIQFVHYSVQEFFSRNTNLLSPSSSIATTCLQYMFSNFFKTVPVDELSSIPFAYYAARYWGYHARGHESDQKVRDRISKLTKDDRLVLITGELELDLKGTSALHVCAAFGLTEVVKELLQNGANVNCREQSCGMTPFMIAVERGHLEVVNTLLKTKAVRVNDVDSSGATALRNVCSAGFPEIVKVLLRQDGIDVHAADNDPEYRAPPLNAAIKFHHTSVAQLLLEVPDLDVNRLDVDGCSALACAVYTDNEPILLLQQPDGSTPLINAISNGWDDVAQLLLKQKELQPNLAVYETGETALFRAVELNVEDLVITMLGMESIDCSVVHKKTGTNLIGIALQKGNYTIARLLVDSGRVSIAPKSTVPLCLAVVENDTEVVIKVMKANEELVCSPKFSLEAPAMNFAVEKGDVQVVQLFIQLLSRSNVSSLYDDFYTNPILLAVDNGNVNMLKTLLDSKCLDVNGRDFYHGRTGLQVAAKTGHIGCVSVLLSAHDIDPNIEDPYGVTPIMHAALNGHLPVVEMLVWHGKADIMHKNTLGKTALEVAIEAGHSDVADYIIVVRKHRRSLFKTIAVVGLAALRLGHSPLSG
ncbi:ankyrin repeat-containing domain protein [Cyathus striatus]|nr:ankyrin repeat-containing domain protein [Cyathus striatus]